jgi:hypothetical protein
MFHLTHGLFFEKIEGGWVRLTKRETTDPKSALVFQVAMDRDAWAQVVEAMSDKPEPVSETQETQTKREGQDNESS